ncbi:DUF6365 family protein [bacterium]|nr:DUF6365 family protein [bacterium]
MKSRTHFFLASFPGSRGEIALAMSIAKDLHQQGDRNVFLIRNEHSASFYGTPYEVVIIDSMFPLDDHMSELVRSYKADSLILTDLHSNSIWLKYSNQGKWFFNQNSVPVLAIDIYHLTEDVKTADAFLDQDYDVSYLSPVPRGRITPVPFISPYATSDAYNAMPAPTVVSEQDKKQTRQDLGIGNDEKLLLMVGAKWQSPSFWQDIHIRKAAMRVPNLISYYVSRIPNVRLIHIGPEPYHIDRSLEGRYHWFNQLEPKRYQSILASADLFLTCNVSSNTLASALVLGIPSLLLRNSFRVRSVEEAIAQIPEKPSEKLLNWLKSTVPINCFYNWPGGYYRLLSRLLQNNPYCETFATAELFFENEVIEQCHKLLYDVTSREQTKQRQLEYVNLVRSLPSGADLIQKHISGIYDSA